MIIQIWLPQPACRPYFFNGPELFLDGQNKNTNVRRPKVVTSARSSVHLIVTLAVIFENSFEEAKESFLK